VQPRTFTEDQVRELAEMGFPEDHSRAALSQSRTVEAAIEILTGGAPAIIITTQELEHLLAGIRSSRWRFNEMRIFGSIIWDRPTPSGAVEPISIDRPFIDHFLQQRHRSTLDQFMAAAQAQFPPEPPRSPRDAALTQMWETAFTKMTIDVQEAVHDLYVRKVPFEVAVQILLLADGDRVRTPSSTKWCGWEDEQNQLKAHDDTLLK
jgi:hypothetical protein